MWDQVESRTKREHGPPLYERRRQKLLEIRYHLMDPVFADIMPNDSNLARFLREFYLFPCFTGYGDRMPAEVRRGKDGRQTTMEILFRELGVCT